MVQRSDWVTCPRGSNQIGFVKRVARDGSWADVDWGQWVKRMPTWALQVQHTIPFGNGTVTDVTRQRELEQSPR